MVDGSHPPRSKQTNWRRSGPKRKRLNEALAALQEAPPQDEDVQEERSSDDEEGENVEPSGTVKGVPDSSFGEWSDPVSIDEDNLQPGQSCTSSSPSKELEKNMSLGSQELEQDAEDSDMWSSDLELLHMEEEEEENESHSEPHPNIDDDIDDNIDYDGDVDRRVFEMSSESEEEEDDANFNFDDESLDRPIVPNANRSVREVLLLDLAVMVRHKLSYECLMDSFQNKNVTLGNKFFPTSKKELWRILGRSDAGLVEHTYCNRCGSYIGIKKVVCLQEYVQCQCSYRILTRKSKSFITVSLRKQFEHFLATPGIADLLKYRETRTKHHDDAIEDIFDGEGYKCLQAEGHATVGSHDFTYVLNTDGCKIRKKAKLGIHPVFLRLNELPPQLRQKFMFLAAVFVDTEEPNMTALFNPVIKEMNSLSKRGVKWNPVADGPEVESKFFPTCFCVDGKERYRMLNMSPHNAYYGCTYCTIKGFVEPGSTTVKYPFLPHPEVPPFADRTHDDMERDMIQAQNGNPVRGHQGCSSLMLGDHIDMRRNNGCDDLHILFECVAPTVTNLILKEAPRVNHLMGYETLTDIIDARLKTIKTPSNVARKPGTCSIKNRLQWTGTEWRNWVIYYGVPCLQNLITPPFIRHFEYLSRIAFLLEQDLILPEHLTEADNCVQLLLRFTEERYGLDRMTLNIHATSHLTLSVRIWGPLWAYSTFNFESWNHRVIKSVMSPNGVMIQIVTRHLINMSLHLALHAQENLSDDVRAQLEKVLKFKRRVHARKVKDRMYLLGRPKLEALTAVETQCLETEGIISVTEALVFPKISVKNSTYAAVNPTSQSKSDDSIIFTYQDTFSTIQKIILIEDLDGIDYCGMFVKEHTVTPHTPLQHARHISALLPAELDLPHYISADNVRSPVVRVEVGGTSYLTPLPNQFEID